VNVIGAAPVSGGFPDHDMDHIKIEFRVRAIPGLVFHPTPLISISPPWRAAAGLDLGGLPERLPRLACHYILCNANRSAEGRRSDSGQLKVGMRGGRLLLN
jgi:hypothetical protein